MTNYWRSVNIKNLAGKVIHKFTSYELFCLGFVEDTYFVRWCHEHLYNVEQMTITGQVITVYVS